MVHRYRNITVVGDTISGEEYKWGFEPTEMKVVDYENGKRQEKKVHLSGRPWWQKFIANRTLLHISLAMEKSPKAMNEIWALQDGYGRAGYTPVQGYDWSGIRDSSPEAHKAMYEVAKKWLSHSELDNILNGCQSVDHKEENCAYPFRVDFPYEQWCDHCKEHKDNRYNPKHPHHRELLLSCCPH
jgi:hypothetical protein